MLTTRDFRNIPYILRTPALGVEYVENNLRYWQNSLVNFYFDPPKWMSRWEQDHTLAYKADQVRKWRFARRLAVKKGLL